MSKWVGLWEHDKAKAKKEHVPTRSFKELCVMFNVSAALMRVLIRQEGAPKVRFSTYTHGVQRNQYGLDDALKWWATNPQERTLKRQIEKQKELQRLAELPLSQTYLAWRYAADREAVTRRELLTQFPSIDGGGEDRLVKKGYLVKFKYDKKIFYAATGKEYPKTTTR